MKVQKKRKRDVSDEGTKEQKGDVIDEGAQEEKRDVSDEGGKEQKRDVIDEGAKRELKRQKGPMKIAVKSFYKRGTCYSSDGDVRGKEIENKDASLSDGDQQKKNVSPDQCTVSFSKNGVKIRDTVTPQRSELRSQYRCGLARQFIRTEYRHKIITSVRSLISSKMRVI